MTSRARTLLTIAGIAALLAGAASAHAAPPQPDPPIPPPPEPAPKTTPDATPAGASAPPGAPAPSQDSAFAPAPNLSKNPIDILPGDVIYPPLGDHRAKPVLWSPEWARFGTGDWIVTGGGVAIALASAIIPPFKKHSFASSNGFDDGIRKGVRLPTSESRYFARDGSDIILSLEATWPFFVDALITTWWYRGSPDAAAQMALVDGEALAIVTALQGATNTIVSRERPYGKDCSTQPNAEQPDQTIDCQNNTRYRSFFSGHTAFTFMSAGLICVHHEKLDLLQGPGDTVACITAYTGAVATGLFRMMGDEHFATDVMVGAGVGTLVGLAVPLFHYRRVNIAPDEKKAIDWRFMPVGTGVGVGGSF